MVKNSLLKIVSVAALIVGFSLGNTAFASHDNEFKFTGVVESLPSPAGFVGDWRVAGRTVHVTGSTHIEQTDGPVAIGATVKVEGTTRADNSFDAVEIEVKPGASGGGSGDDGSVDDSEQPTFKGTVQVLSTAAGFIGDWLVGGRTIHVSTTTRIETDFGPVAVGAFVEVYGTMRPDGSMDATKIETKSNVAGGDGRDELKGVIESLPGTSFIGDWRISGRTVHVTAETIINQEHGAAAEGASVEVHGTRRADGSIDAGRIEVNPSSGEGRPAKVKGAIESLPASGLVGDWIVGGRLVHVVSSTRLSSEHGPFAIGTRVKVKGLLMTDGSVVATRVQVRDSN